MVELRDVLFSLGSLVIAPLVFLHDVCQIVKQGVPPLLFLPSIGSGPGGPPPRRPLRRSHARLVVRDAQREMRLAVVVAGSPRLGLGGLGLGALFLLLAGLGAAGFTPRLGLLLLFVLRNHVGDLLQIREVDVHSQVLLVPVPRGETRDVLGHQGTVDLPVDSQVEVPREVPVRAAGQEDAVEESREARSPVLQRVRYCIPWMQSPVGATQRTEDQDRLLARLHVLQGSEAYEAQALQQRCLVHV
mmetsp:Transcript_82217/g.266463  ORF Transcript_82217/g.266463 Transcript_82217/m.266463 type:complete len:245 (-) Transcript_82217:904-1638(-)